VVVVISHLERHVTFSLAGPVGGQKSWIGRLISFGGHSAAYDHDAEASPP
jgi:hypothetical protein